MASSRRLIGRIYYMEIVATLIGLTLTAGLAHNIIAGETRWYSVLIFSSFVLVAGAMAVRRVAAYEQPKPWLVGTFAITSMVAAVTLLWPLSPVSFLVACTGISVLLLVGFVF